MSKINIKVVIGELHKAFSYLNRDLFQGELPEPAILIQSRGKNKLTLGWCTVGKVWKNEATQEERYEINLVAEAMNRGLLPVMSTLLHEMVHLHNLEKGIKDTSREYTYHNKRFKEVAENHGLIIDHAEKIGWSVTKLQQQTIKLIYSYGLNEEAFNLGRKELGESEEAPKKKGKSKKYICPECATIIRANREVNVICGDCNVKFILDEPIEEEPKKQEINIICHDCGCLGKLVAGDEIKCKECGSENIEETNMEVDDNLIEVDDELYDENKKLVPVKQGMFKVAQ